MPTFTAIGERVATQLGEEYSDLDVKNTFDEWALESVQTILSKETWPFANVLTSFSTSDGTENYALTGAGGQVKALYRTDVDLWLSYVPLEQLRASQLDHDSEAPPRYWAFAGMSANTFTIKLWPIPDDEYEIYVYGDESINIDSTSVSSSIPLPSPMIPLVQTGIRQLYYEHTGNDAAAAREQLKFRDQLNDARGNYMVTRALRLHFGYSDVPNHDDAMGRPVMPTSIPVVPIS